MPAKAALTEVTNAIQQSFERPVLHKNHNTLCYEGICFKSYQPENYRSGS